MKTNIASEIMIVGSVTSANDNIADIGKVASALFMRIGKVLIFLISLNGCAGTPAAPYNVPEPPPLVDFNSEAVQRQLASEQVAALRKATTTAKDVTRSFIVGWEMHYGYIFMPPSSPNDVVMPDMPDVSVRANFDREQRQENLSQHVGQRLVCVCTGVEWSFYASKRFVVRQAKLYWE